MWLLFHQRGKSLLWSILPLTTASDFPLHTSITLNWTTCPLKANEWHRTQTVMITSDHLRFISQSSPESGTIQPKRVLLVGKSVLL